MKKVILLSLLFFYFINIFSQSHTFKNINVKCHVVLNEAAYQEILSDVTVSKMNNGYYKLILSPPDNSTPYAEYVVKYCTVPSFPGYNNYTYEQVSSTGNIKIIEDGLVTPVKLSEVAAGKSANISMHLRNENKVYILFKIDCK